jgi:hypothetical protein
MVGPHWVIIPGGVFMGRPGFVVGEILKEWTQWGGRFLSPRGKEIMDEGKKSTAEGLS